MKIPRSIDIYGMRCRVVETAKPVDHFHPDAASGMWDPDRQTIYVDKRLDKRMKIITFLHECNHAFFYRFGIRETGLPVAMEEMLVDGLATFYAEAFEIRCK